ncbi:MAG: TIGR02556 family CRISPR-associated protein [Syntrophomonadaceae bacterium]|nr:TIGR02556 family CRISPR-associated protein [Syntrophomonadaceae bacterium]
MLESVIELGNSVLEKKDKLSALIKEVSTVKNKKQQHVCKFIFDTKKLEFTVDVNEEIDDDTARKYLYIGSADSSGLPQWYVTGTSSNYILSEFFPNIVNLGIMQDEADNILKNFYYKNNLEDIGNKKYQYMLNIEKLKITQKSMQGLLEEAKKESKPGKKMLELVKKEFENWLKQKYNINPNREISLYTVIIDGELVSDNEGYRQAVLESKKAQTRDKKEAGIIKSQLECNICGSRKGISKGLDKMQIKYFTTNQLIFKGQFDSYEKNLNLCSNCVEKMQAGEVFLQKNMATRIAGFEVYVIPDLIYGSQIDAEIMENLSSKIMATVNTSKSIKGLEDFRNRVEELKEFNDIYYLLDFVFIRRANAATKILRLIKDVKPSFFEKLAEVETDLNRKVETYFSGRYKYKKGLEKIYYLTPIRLKRGNYSSFRDLLSLYDALFTGHMVEKRRIIGSLTKCFAIVFYEHEGFNIRDKKENLHYKVLDGMFFLEFLQKMGCLEGGGEVNYGGLDLKEELCSFMENMGYDEMHAAMFLLGYLVGEVGNAQYRRLKNSGGEGNYKPVLNKINFNGIDKSKLMRLRSEIFNKLRQEKILPYNERVFAVCSQLMDKNINNWKLNKDENLFYLLSGYAYATAAPIKKKEEEENNE